MFKLGDPKPPGSGMRTGQKIQRTLDREEAKRIFREKQSEVWENTIKKLNPHYVADRMMGKEADQVDINANVSISALPDDVVIKAAELLKKQLTDDNSTAKKLSDAAEHSVSSGVSEHN